VEKYLLACAFLPCLFFTCMLTSLLFLLLFFSSLVLLAVEVIFEFLLYFSVRSFSRPGGCGCIFRRGSFASVLVRNGMLVLW